VEADLYQYYLVHAPGLVSVVGLDVWDGSPAQLQAFKNAAGVTFPLLLDGGSATGGDCFATYGDRDNYVIVDGQEIVRFSARSQGYQYGATLDVPRMRALVDSLLANPVGVGDPPAVPGPTLELSPNPASGSVAFSLVTDRPGERVRLTVLDLAGRRVATVADAAATGPSLRATWNGRDPDGVPVHPGVYLVRAEVGERSLVRRLVVLR
jgi:flagellar hook capping protein FlgD